MLGFVWRGQTPYWVSVHILGSPASFFLSFWWGGYTQYQTNLTEESRWQSGMGDVLTNHYSQDAPAVIPREWGWCATHLLKGDLDSFGKITEVTDIYICKGPKGWAAIWWLLVPIVASRSDYAWMTNWMQWSCWNSPFHILRDRELTFCH